MSKASPTRTPKTRLFLATTALVLSSVFLMGQFSRSVRKADDDQFWEFTALFAEVYDEVRNRFVDEVEAKRVFEGALQGMFLTLDQHSQYMDPDNYNQLEKDTEGSFSGVGIQIQIKDGVLTVISPIPGSPAAKAGVRPWDRIIEIDGKETKGMTITEAVKKLTGPTGTTVQIGVYREGNSDLIYYTIVRKRITVESVYSKMLDGSIGYARLTKFSDNTSRDLRRAIEDFRKEGAKGMILDLRYNTGGLLKESVEVSNLFLPRGKLIVSTKGRLRNNNQELRGEKDPMTDLPLIVLINRASASASEIVAGALKDHNRAVVLGIKGQRSFGKGSVQTIEELNHSFEKDENGNYRPAAIRLTTARYYTPSGTSIDKTGVTPDIAVELPRDQTDDIIMRNLIGEPSVDEEDSGTSVSTFRWDQRSTGTESPEESESEGEPQASATEEESEEFILDRDGAILTTKDTSTTGPQPKRTIPVDMVLYPEEAKAREEEERRKKEEEARVRRKDFVDYQLLVAERLLRDHIEKGIDFYADTAGMPKQPDDTGIAASPATDPRGN